MQPLSARTELAWLLKRPAELPGRILYAMGLGVGGFLVCVQFRRRLGGVYSAFERLLGGAKAERSSTRHFKSLPANPAWTVVTRKGRVCGVDLNGGIAFLGLPFAEPPVGDLRWAAPREASPWTGVLECSRFGPSCPQRRIPGTGNPAIPVPKRWADELVHDDRPGSGTQKNADKLPLGLDEDCLHLNVYTPSLQGKRPTLVWFHGGNLTSGSASSGLVFDPAARHGANPTFLSQQQDLVVVTAAYRVNVFGFLNLEGGDANCGLLDAVAALRWVRDEIGNFGGDCENVTVCGFSAGGHVTSQLLCMPAAQGLFHKAICMSGSAQWSLGTQEDHNRRIAEPFAKQLGFASLKDMTIEKARRISAESLRRAYMASSAFLECGTLTVDGKTIPKDPLDMLLEGCAKGVKVLSGVSRDEGVFSTNVKRKWAYNSDVIKDIQNHFGSACYLLDGDADCLRSTDMEGRRQIARELANNYRDLVTRFNDSPPAAKQKCVKMNSNKFPAHADEAYELAVKILGDHDFMLPHMTAVWALSQHSPVYTYVFSGEAIPDLNIAHHGADIPYLYGTHARPDGNPAPELLSSQIMEAWASFARTGDPSTPALNAWPPISFPTDKDPSVPLPGVPSCWEHMNFEHGRTGVVSYGAEETRMWHKIAIRLGELLEEKDGRKRLRPAVARMAEALQSEFRVTTENPAPSLHEIATHPSWGQ